MSNSRRRSEQCSYNYPSFSSSLLEEIYRSFDDDSERENSSHHSDSATMNGYKKVRYNKTNCYAKNSFVEREKSDEKFRVNRYVLDQWMIENNINKNQKVYHRRNSMNSTVNSVAKLNSSSSTSSSDSASSGTFGFSYSDSESQHGSWKSRNPTLKPIKTAVIEQEYHRKISSDDVTTKQNKKKINSSSNNKDRNHQKEGNLQKRALKLYGDLKKVKQPISPGGKFATFLNSLFNSTTPKKPKISASSPLSSSSSLSQLSKSNATSYTTSTPSTASSYSRSCLSKTPSSTGKFERRSVRFCPVSTVMAYSEEREHDVDLISEKASIINDELKVQMMEKHRRVEEVAKELLKNYHHHHNGGKFQNEVNVNLNNKKINNDINMISSFEDEDEDDDDASCCSSDLFELDNLLDIGGDQRYCEELPVYETTHVHTNRAIAKGFIL